MKYLATLMSVSILIFMLVFSQFKAETQANNFEYLRIHIRANSNNEIDQNIKYQIKDAVVDFLIPYLSTCESKKDAEFIIEQNLRNLESVADNILKQNNFDYESNARLCLENFPTRNYGNLILESGFYDALILDLGQAKGDNWWCVVYPPLCFVNGSTTVNVYKSRILEIINSFFS